MFSSFNARIKPPMIGGFPTYLVFSMVGAGITAWLFLLLMNETPINFLMAIIFFGCVGFGIYVIKNHNDWLLLAAKRSSRNEADAPLIKVNY